MYKICLICVITIAIHGCAGYRSSFSCPDSKGLYCTPLNIVNQEIDSGKIENVEGNCCKRIKPDLSPNKTYKVWFKK